MQLLISSFLNILLAHLKKKQHNTLNLCHSTNTKNLYTLMEIKGFSQCIAANKQQACGLAAAASCGMVAACEFFVCKLVLLLLVAAILRLLVAATLPLLVAATLPLLVAATEVAARCLLQPCGLCVFRMQIRFRAHSCSLFAANSCSLFAANSCGLFAANSCSHLIFVSLYYKE